jgi:DNA-binding transcriptional LysR family regulator
MFLKDLADYSVQGLRIFCYVASMGSVAQAAEALGLSQPAVSLQISNLEKALGFSLFERSGRRNVLTVRGQDLYEKLLPQLERLELLLLDAVEEESLSKPKLRLASVEGVGEFWLLNRFRDFRKQSESSRLFLEIIDNDIIMDRLSTGRVDIAITTRKVEAPGIVSELLMNEDLVPVGHEDDIKHLRNVLENQGKYKRYWEQINWIGYGDSFSEETWAQKWIESRGTVINRRFKYRHLVNSYLVIRKLLGERMGVCVAPKHIVEDLLSSGVLSSLDSEEFPPLRNQLYISYRQQSMSRVTKEFHSWILEAAKEYQQK